MGRPPPFRTPAEWQRCLCSLPAFGEVAGSGLRKEAARAPGRLVREVRTHSGSPGLLPPRAASPGACPPLQEAPLLAPRPHGQALPAGAASDLQEWSLVSVSAKEPSSHRTTECSRLPSAPGPPPLASTGGQWGLKSGACLLRATPGRPKGGRAGSSFLRRWREPESTWGPPEGLGSWDTAGHGRASPQPCSEGPN